MDPSPRKRHAMRSAASFIQWFSAGWCTCILTKIRLTRFSRCIIAIDSRKKNFSLLSAQKNFTIFLPFTKNCRTTNRDRNRAESNSRGLTKERAVQARPLQSQPCWVLGDLKVAATRLLFFELEAGLVLFEEFAEVFGHVEEADPLLVIQRHREAAEAVHADAALFTDAKFQGALLAGFRFLLKLGDARQ